jgi:hypothetical protein
MLTSLLMAAQLAAAPIACDARSGWNAGRAGQPVPEACRGDDYREAHRLGESLKQLQDEHARIEAELPTLAPPAQASARRRPSVVSRKHHQIIPASFAAILRCSSSP